jgi:oxalate decarboxylase
MADEIPEIRYPMEAQVGRVDPCGSAKEATAVEFPISQSLAGVSMRLKPGALRELHWHANAAEWGYVFSGRCRTTIIDPQGCRETLDFGPGDVWYFPRGHGHSIQGLGPGECHFLLVFDNGYFSEFATFSLSDWIAQTPPDVLAKNLGVPSETFARFPKKEVYIAVGPVPPPLAESPGIEHAPPLTHKYRLMAQEPRTYPGGTLRLVSSREFPISATMTGALMTLKPGALRELHWHPNADEWQYFIAGRARMTVFGSKGRARTAEFGPGDVGFAPRGYGHYIENIGTDECRMLLMFNSGAYEEISFSGWLASNPRALVATNFGVPESVIAGFPTKEVFIAGPGRPAAS